MTADPIAAPYRLARDTALNWEGDIVWLFPHQVMEHHAPVDALPLPAAQTTRDAADPTPIERLNDWDGSDASGVGTAIWHPDAVQATFLNDA